MAYQINLPNGKTYYQLPGHFALNLEESGFFRLLCSESGDKTLSVFDLSATKNVNAKNAYVYKGDLTKLKNLDRSLKMITLSDGELLFAGQDKTDNCYKFYIHDVFTHLWRYICKFQGLSKPTTLKFAQILLHHDGKIYFTKPKISGDGNELYSLNLANKTLQKFIPLPQNVESSLCLEIIVGYEPFVQWYDNKLWLLERKQRFVSLI